MVYLASADSGGLICTVTTICHFRACRYTTTVATSSRLTRHTTDTTPLEGGGLLLFAEGPTLQQQNLPVPKLCTAGTPQP
jgi:hypothetical protein